MIERIAVRLIDESKNETQGTFAYNADDGNEDCTLTLLFAGQEITVTAASYFDALSRIREQLEVRGLRPHCYGSCRNVRPSPMSSQMGGGLRAYRLIMGQQARIQDLVDIFSTGCDVEAVSVEEQNQYYEEWSQSLKRKKPTFFERLWARLTRIRGG